ncbi:MAG TPA: VCBS repeat-containing protein [Pyrinomonadaceae bacterium]|nr:VCBS repeat-containing protein [Pyrinomonadaceae bacterium]
MLKIIRFVFFTTLFFALLATTRVSPVASGQGENMDYLPFSKRLLRPFKLKKIELREDLRSGRALNVAGVQIQEEKAAGADDPNAESIHRIVFSGRNLSGKAWRVGATASNHYHALYEGDLDRNGSNDLVLAMSTGGNGLAPSTRLIFVTFDRRGDATLFEGTGYYQSLPDGILDVADLDGDGRAELVHMVFDDGYWITDVYRVRESRWSRVAGRFANMRFPLYTRFTSRPNHKPVHPERGRKPVAPNLLKPSNG